MLSDVIDVLVKVIVYKGKVKKPLSCSCAFSVLSNMV